MTVANILEQLKSTTKRTEKEAILSGLTGTEEYLFKRVAVMTYSPNINYWIKEVDWPEESESDTLFETEYDVISLDAALDKLESEIATRKVTGNKAHDRIIEIYQSLINMEKYTFKCVVDRDLKAGVSVKTINKIWPDLVYDHPYMRGSSFNKKNLKNINFPCISQTKEDGAYEDIIVVPNSFIEQRARSGAINNNFLSNGLVDALKTVEYPVVFMGEILAFEDSTRTKLMSRQKSNGYINSNEVDPERLLHVLWDMVPYEDFKQGVSKTKYSHRFDMLKRMIISLNQHTDQVKVVDSRMVTDIDDVIEHLKENLEDGLEGTMLKNVGLNWKNGTSKDQVKVKVEFECDLKVVGFNQGKTAGEWDEKLGSITFESSEGLINVNVGTGFSDEERVEIWQNRVEYMKKIATIKSNDIITNDLHPDKYSLFLPRIVKFRPDKTKADSYNRVLEQKEAFVETLKALEE